MKVLSPILLYLPIPVYTISASETSKVETFPPAAEISTLNATLSPLNTDNVYFVAHPAHNASNPVPTVGEWKPVDLTNPLHMKRQGSCPAGTEAAAANSGSGRGTSAGNGNLFLWSILGGMLASLLGLALWTRYSGVECGGRVSRRCCERTWQDDESGTMSVETMFHQENPWSKFASILSVIKTQKGRRVSRIMVSISLSRKIESGRDKRVKISNFPSSLKHFTKAAKWSSMLRLRRSMAVRTFV